MLGPLTSRTTNSVLPTTQQQSSLLMKPTAMINDQIANMKISKSNVINNNDQENLSRFRSKIPIMRPRLECGKQTHESLKPLSNNQSELKQHQLQCKSLQQLKEETTVAKPTIENIDNESNCFLLSDYAPDIYEYLHQLEKSLALEPNYLSKHNNLITPHMRSVLVNWINGIHRTFHLVPETLYLAISIVDRVLSREFVEKSKLQLLGATAIFVAAKYEEMYYPEIKDFVTICDNLYTKNDILRMEIRILKITNFELSGPSPLYFLRRGSKAAHSDSRVHMMGKYFCELCVMDYQCSQWLPSLIAATSLYLAIKLNHSSDNVNNGLKPSDPLETSIWTPTIEHYTGYTIHDVRKYAGQLCRLIISSETSKHQNCRKKYSSQKCMNISNLSPNSMRIIKKLAT